MRASHPALEPLARLLAADRRDFDRHEGVFVQVAPATGTLQGAFVHRTCRGQGAGGVRLWRYDTVEDYLRDGLRLARGMTHKNALAGLWWGGGKGVMARGTGADLGDPAARRRDLRGVRRVDHQPARLLRHRRGRRDRRSRTWRRSSRAPASPPASRPPSAAAATPRSPPPAASCAAWRRPSPTSGCGTLAGKTVAVQGLGHVGEPLVGFLREARRRRGSSGPTSIRPAARRSPARFPGAGRLRLRGPRRGARRRLDPGRAGRHPRPLRHRRRPQSAHHPGDPAPDRLRRRQQPARGARSATTGSSPRAASSICPTSWSTAWGSSTAPTSSTATSTGDPHLEAHLGAESAERHLPPGADGPRGGASGAARPRPASPSTSPRSARVEPHPIWGHRGARIIRSLVADGWAEG